MFGDRKTSGTHVITAIDPAEFIQQVNDARDIHGSDIESTHYALAVDPKGGHLVLGCFIEFRKEPGEHVH